MEAGPSTSSAAAHADQVKDSAAAGSTSHDAELAIHMAIDQMKDEDIDNFLLEGAFMGGSQDTYGKEKLLDATFFNAFPDIFSPDYVDQPL